MKVWAPGKQHVVASLGKKNDHQNFGKKNSLFSCACRYYDDCKHHGIGGGWTGSWGGRYVPTEKVSLKTGIERDTHVEYGKCQHIS